MSLISLIQHIFHVGALTDAGDKIFVWLGTQLQEKLNDQSLIGKIGKLYLKQDKSGRDIESEQIIYVKQGSEEDDFKAYFNSWN